MSSGFTLTSPAIPTITRPTCGGKCYSGISSTVVDVYDTTGFVSTTTLRETGGGLEALTPLMDGFTMVGVIKPGNGEAAAVTTSSGGEVSGTPVERQSVTQLENPTSTANTTSRAHVSLQHVPLLQSNIAELRHFSLAAHQSRREV